MRVQDKQSVTPFSSKFGPLHLSVDKDGSFDAKVDKLCMSTSERIFVLTYDIE